MLVSPTTLFGLQPCRRPASPPCVWHAAALPARSSTLINQACCNLTYISHVPSPEPHPHPTFSPQDPRHRRGGSVVTQVSNRSQPTALDHDPKPLPTPPSTLPVVGNLIDFFKAPLFPRQLLAWAEELGGVYEISFLGAKYVIVTDPKLVPQIVGRGSNHPEPPLNKASGYKAWSRIESENPDISSLFSSPSSATEEWKEIRRAFGRALGPGQMRPLFPGAVGYAEEMVAAILRESSPSSASLVVDVQHSSASGPVGIDANALSKRLTLDVIGKSTLDLHWGFLDGSVEGQPEQHIPELIVEGMHELQARGREPLRILFPLLYKSTYEEGEETLKRFRNLCRDMLATIRQRGEPPEGCELLRTSILSLSKEGISDEQLIAEIAAVVVGGYETTANALTWALFALVRHEGVADRVVEELQGAGLMHEDGSAGLRRPLQFDDMSRLPILEAFINESLRLYSTAPNGTIRHTEDNEYQLGDYKIGPGTNVWISFTALHNSSSNWERPDEFSIDRWFTADGYPAHADLEPGTSISRCPFASAAERTDVLTRHARAAMASFASSRSIKFMPFSDGGRSCVGRHLGMLELRVALIHVLAAFSISLDEKMNTEEQVLERQRVTLTMEPEGGLWMKFTPREAKPNSAGEARGAQVVNLPAKVQA